jgi:hypothetical protein
LTKACYGYTPPSFTFDNGENTQANFGEEKCDFRSYPKAFVGGWIFDDGDYGVFWKGTGESKFTVMVPIVVVDYGFLVEKFIIRCSEKQRYICP